MLSMTTLTNTAMMPPSLRISSLKGSDCISAVMMPNVPKPCSKKGESLSDIDDHDYIDQMYENSLTAELIFHVNEKYMSLSQNEINFKMRALLIDWMVNVSLKFKFVDETLQIAVAIMDMFLSKKRISRGKFQLIGITSLLIASKYEETYYPEVNDFTYLTDDSYSFDEVVSMESTILKCLDFKITFPTASKFLTHYIKKISNENIISFDISRYLIENSLLHGKMLKYLPSMIACSALYIANEKTGLVLKNKMLLKYCNYSLDDILECLTDLKSIVEERNPNLTALYKKYSFSKYSKVSSLF